MAAQATDGMYVDYSIPLGLYSLIQGVIGATQNDPNTPQVSQPTAGRQWFSQPRPGSDPTTEVLTVNFKLPLSVSEVGFEALRTGSHIEVWYQDRQNNWRQVLDESRNPLALNLQASSALAWYKAHYYCYPIVAKALQFRFTRVYDSVVGNVPYCVGMRNGLIRRNIYTRSDGTTGIEPTQDALGNVISSYIKDWDATKAFDNHPTTFWRSMPMPDPNAVCSLYLDCRTTAGSGQLIDTLYIDPVYINQTLNLYYSNDDTVGTRKLSPVTAVPSTDTNTTWQLGIGRWDSSTSPGTSDYEFPMAWGPLVSQDTWIGIEWAPDFVATSGPPQNPVLFQVTPPASVGGANAVQTVTLTGTPTGGTFTLTYGGHTTSALAYNASASDVQTALVALSSIGTGNVRVSGISGGPNPPWAVTFQNTLGNEPITTMTATSSLTGTDPGVTVATTTTGVTPSGGTQYWPKIYYDVGAAEIVLELTNGTLTQTYSVPLSPLPVQYAPLRIVVGWGYSPATVFLSVKTADGTLLGTSTATPSNLPTQMTLDGSIGFVDFRGLFTAHVVKLENWSVGQASFQANPGVYVSPDPVQPDPSGNIPATTLDNAIYAAGWVLQENGTGGSHESNFEDKTWTPIWSNYLTQQGKLFFPQQINLKYLKLEFTNLTEEPYPVYDSGISVTYNIFPVSVTQTATQPHLGLLGVGLGLLTVGADVLLSGIGTVNWLNPSTVNNAVNSIFGQTVNPIVVQSGPGTTITSLPSSATANTAGQTRQEVSSPWVYRRSLPNASTLAAQQLNTASSTNWAQTIINGVSLVGGQILDSFTPLVQFATNPASLPTQGSDFWVFPGATLRLPAIVMNGLTAVTETVLGRAPTTETRLRFNTTSVHRYATKTVTRDAAVAYFAGIREVQPYVSTYIAELDPPSFTFSSYDPSQFVLTNTKALDSGPISTAGSLYTIVNSEFDTDIAEWTQAEGNWSYDDSLTNGHYYPGSATVLADGTEKELLSTEVDVAPGVHIDASVWVQWSGLTATASSTAIQLRAMYYNNGTFVSSQTQGLTYTTWPASTPPTGGVTWTQIVASQATSTGFTVPAGVNQMRLALVVTSAASAGQIWFDTVELGTPDTVEATVFKDFITTSTFAKIKATFSDSGLVRSDDMWAQEDPLDTNISSTALAYYTSTIPDVIPGGMWGDTFADWADTNITWGEPRAEVAINVDPDRIFDGKRVLHFTRAGGAEEAGIKVRQFTNFVANGLFRIGAVFYKPTANTNQVTIRLRRLSDGVYIYQETFDPVVGYWYEYVSSFTEIPDSEDQIYTVELVCSGDQPDEFYLNDLYVEIASIRYFLRLGDESQFLHDVTALRYADSAIVSTTTPVNEFSVQLAILSPKAWAYGAQITPVYLK